MKTRRLLWLFVFTFVLAMFAFANSALADDQPDPPSRVARLSYIEGQVSFSPSGTDDWVGAVLNRPVTTGDKLWTDQNSRAELHIGSSVVRIGEMTGFSFLNLDDNITQIRLTEGTINLRVIRLADNETIEVDTPNLAFSALRPGHYRINVNEAGDTSIISVRDGEGEVTGGGSAYTLHPGDYGTFTGTDTLSSDVEALPDEDSFDSWCDERDLREEHAVAQRYVPDGVIGYEDLDDYGGWRPSPDYGYVWYPHVAVIGWAPYRYGHWAWVSPWGWTWVDDAPWGFAPFHYGRWVFVGGAWGWVPGPRPVVGVAYVRPVYAPALVAWVGGPHFAAGVGFAAGGFAVGVNVGWFPLGPREVFVPSYPVSRTYVTNINISNTVVERTVVNNYYNTTVVNKTVVNNVTYVNQRVTGAVTVTSPQAFTSAQPVARNIVAVDQREVVSAGVAVRAPAVVPPKQAVLGAGAAARVQPPAAVLNRPVVAKTTPPPPPPSFAARQAAIRTNQGQPISVAQSRQLATTQAQTHAAATPVKIAPPSKPAAAAYNQQGSRENSNPGPLNTNRPANNNPQNAKGFADRPPSSRPAAQAQNNNTQLEQKHQQEVQQLQQQHDQEYQQLQQKQAQERQNLQQQNADTQKQAQLQQQHQQQLEQLQQKHQQEQQNLNQKQQAEHAQAKQSQPKPKDDKHK
jgi:hypothetical protein